MIRAKWALAPLACLALTITGPAAPVAAQQAPSAPEQKAEKEVERHVRVIRLGGSYLGVTLEEVEKDDVGRLKLPAERGAIVRSVEPDSPAEKAGLKADDVILGFQGEAIHTARQLTRLVREAPVGRTVALDVSRDGATQKLSATLAERERASGGAFSWVTPDFHVEVPEPPEPPEPPEMPIAPRALLEWSGPRKLGIQYMEIGEQLAKHFKVSQEEAVLVSSVEADSPAAKAGMKAGDVIVKLDGTAIEGASSLRRALNKAEAGQAVTITVQRDGKPLDLKVTLGGAERRRSRGTGL
jgi:C-terminal processing protease CtpA/Prc